MSAADPCPQYGYCSICEHRLCECGSEPHDCVRWDERHCETCAVHRCDPCAAAIAEAIDGEDVA